MEEDEKYKKDLFDLEKVNYYLYRDDNFLRKIYSQININIPDLGIIEYRGTNTHLYTKEIKGFGEEENELLVRENGEDQITEKNREKLLSELRFSDTDGINIVREYANIEEIKKINVESLFKNYIKEVKKKAINGDENVILVQGKIEPYSVEEYAKKFEQQPEDIFAKVDNKCIWLKKSLLDTDINILTNIFGNVNIIGYMVSDETKTTPKVIKAIVIYI